ncbi:hypothetical protein L2E82_16092 [Cichorium intybus]|uniref:Uncharacterized protein n=1 Tax=Cichorium intybus TaxID=13427 RepID=A0ACB9F438_CICIN|nr:hypothetical protein L2E82_16092 [Cichorium intybus]
MEGSRTSSYEVDRRETVAVMNTNDLPERDAIVLLDNVPKEVTALATVQVAESDSKQPTAIVGWGVEDVYGKDSATDDHFINSWSVPVGMTQARRTYVRNLGLPLLHYLEVASHGESTGYEVPCLIVAAKDDIDPYPTAIRDSTRVQI